MLQCSNNLLCGRDYQHELMAKMQFLCLSLDENGDAVIIKTEPSDQEEDGDARMETEVTTPGIGKKLNSEGFCTSPFDLSFFYL